MSEYAKMISKSAIDYLRAENARLKDLVRYCRSDLHAAGLITDEEYAGMMGDGGASVARLASYDDMRAENARLTAERDAALSKLAQAREALERIRRGYLNILEFRRLDNGRYGNLTREEVDGGVAEIDAALAASLSPESPLPPPRAPKAVGKSGEE